MDTQAGVVGRPPQVLFSIPDGSAPLTYDSDGQFQMSPGGSSVQEGPSSELSGPQEASEAVAASEPPITQSLIGRPSGSFVASFETSTPSVTPVSKPSLTTPTTTTTGSVQESHLLSASSLPGSFPMFGISTEVASALKSMLTSPSPSESISLNSLSQNKSGSMSGFHSSPKSSTCIGNSCSAATNVAALSTSTSTAAFKTGSPVVPAKLSNFGVQPTSWYLGIVFAVIAGVSLLVFIAIFIYSCRKRRRMAQDIDLPWAGRPGDEEEARLFFDSRSMSFRGGNLAINPGTLPPGSRQPAEDLSANRSSYTLHDHPIPGSCLFSDEPLASKPQELASGRQLRSANGLRILPSHLIDEELADDTSRYVPGRPIRLRKRSRGYLDDVNPYINPPVERLDVQNSADVTSTSSAHQTLVDRVRNRGHQDQLFGFGDRLPTPGRDQPKEDIEPWAASFKAGLFNAFSAFAANLKSQDSSAEPDLARDKLTRLPTRRRPSIRSQVSSRRSATKSPAWILHEKADGTGTVHFLPSLEKHYDSRDTPTCEGRKPLHPLAEDGVIATYDDEKRDSGPTERAIYPRAPLLPATAMIHNSPLTKRPSVSRDSSFYSTSSLTTSSCDRPASLGSLAGIPLLHRKFSSQDVVVLEPGFFASRESSTIKK